MNKEIKKHGKVKLYVIRYVNAYDEIVTILVKYKTFNRYKKNWHWKYNGDYSGLECFEIEKESIFNEIIEESEEK